MKVSHKAAYKPEPAKNVDEFKPAAPQSSPLPRHLRKKNKVNTPDKRADQEVKPQAPDGAKWGCQVGMDRGE